MSTTRDDALVDSCTNLSLASFICRYQNRRGAVLLRLLRAGSGSSALAGVLRDLPVRYTRFDDEHCHRCQLVPLHLVMQ